MSIAVTPELAEKIRQRMDSGKYQNEDELFEDAFRALDTLEVALAPWKTEVEARLQEAENEESHTLDVDALMTEVRAEATPMKNAS